jgi:ABC-type Zn2+ transport system substrate-binding protein/surface adhesin
MSKNNNVIDLKRHPLYIKKVMQSQFETFDNMLPLNKFNEYMENLKQLNKQVDKLNKKIDKKLKKLEEELDGKEK